jgi:hypothetical protein
MNRKGWIAVLALSALGAGALAFAQERPGRDAAAEHEAVRALEQRVQRLERAIARIDARLAARERGGAMGGGMMGGGMMGGDMMGGGMMGGGMMGGDMMGGGMMGGGRSNERWRSPESR